MPFNIPEELREYPNWICWNEVLEQGCVKATKKPINPHTGKLASPTDPGTWSTLEEAVAAAPYCSGIGFVLSDNCPYSVIDLDDPYELTPEGLPKYSNPDIISERQKLIASVFDSYQEVSPSGRGLHIWVRGKVPSGGRREAVEVYSSGRYMTVTGNCFNSSCIKDHTEKLNQLWAEIKAEKAPVSIVDKPEIQCDYDILKIASQAANGQKFIDLFEGRWNDYYPSQSEADFALVDVLAFYTQNRIQITRLFRQSELGKRPKAQRQQYVDYMLNRAFDRMIPEIDMDGLRNNLEEQLIERQRQAVKEVNGEQLSSNPLQLSNTTIANGEQLSQQSAVNKPTEEFCQGQLSIDKFIYSNSNIYEHSNISKTEYSIPPGLVGEIAKFIHDSAPRPVPEIAIAAAIGLMSGICGRSYNVSGTGLNQYTFLIGKTGRGKEAISTGIDKLMTSVTRTVPAAMEFVGPSKIASQQALLKYIAKSSKSFVSVMGEFADTLKRMSNNSRDASQQGLRQTMLDLYNKSGKDSTLGKMVYSDREKNTETITAPAFSVIGEATPEKFYELLSKDMISEGLLPRFCIIEYHGNRPKLNKNHKSILPSTQLLDYFASVCAYSLQLNNGNNVLDVKLDSEAENLFDNYDTFCDNKINQGNEVTQELWNRAHIKALKLAALLAVGCNYINPVIDKTCAEWALKLITNDVTNMLSRFDSGEIGTQNVQNEQTIDIKKAVKTYVTCEWDQVSKYPGSTQLTHNMKVVPHSFITAYCRSRASFKNDRLGPILALKTCIASMLECDEIRELSPQDKRTKGLAGNARLYMVSGMKI